MLNWEKIIVSYLQLYFTEIKIIKAQIFKAYTQKGNTWTYCLELPY